MDRCDNHDFAKSTSQPVVRKFTHDWKWGHEWEADNQTKIEMLGVVYEGGNVRYVIRRSGGPLHTPPSRLELLDIDGYVVGFARRPEWRVVNKPAPISQRHIRVQATRFGEHVFSRNLHDFAREVDLSDQYVDVFFRYEPK